MVLTGRLLLLVLLVACGDGQSPPRVVDLEGPHGFALAPGPWPVAVLVSDGEPEVMWAVGDDPLSPLALTPRGDRYLGMIPDLPLGSVVRYYARVEDDLEPPGAPDLPRRAVVVPSEAQPDAGVGPGGCRLVFRRPVEGAVLGPEDDGAPQAGLQVTVVLTANLDDGMATRLTVGSQAYAGAAGSGVVAFPGVTLEEGPRLLVADAARAGGEPCSAEIRVRVSGPLVPGP